MKRPSPKRVLQDYVNLNGTSRKITIYLEKRKNCRASIVRDGLNIRIPSFLGKQEQTKRIESLKQWGLKKLAQQPAQYKTGYRDGDQLQVGNKCYSLKIERESRKTGSSWVDRDWLCVKLPHHLAEGSQRDMCQKLVRRAVAQDHLPAMKERVYDLNQRHFQEKIHQVRLRYNHSNWGSCSSSRNITISTRVLLAPDDVVDYVCIHELAHLIEANHSYRFWQLVHKAMPDFREKERWLKKNGQRCYF
ncbi:MAG: hypothetical protein BRD50_01290 [Bacteroidetes bacterium SW_11_45_7]|nr:MAG: hypothetical protein BRD50_01290 [Bacteroidetes bacterium SW_11_45_7]